MTAEAKPPAACVTTRSMPSLPMLPLVASVAEAVELFRGTAGSRLDLQRGHQAWSGPSNQASMHCGIHRRRGHECRYVRFPLFVLFVASVKSSAVRIVCGAYSRGAYFSALGRLGEIETAFERKRKWPRKAYLVLLPNARRNGVQ